MSSLDEQLTAAIKRGVLEALAEFFGDSKVASRPAEPAPAQADVTTSGWVTIGEATFMSGRNKRSIVEGQPVKVRGLGRGGGIGSGYRVARIQTRGGEVNVDVNKGRGTQARTVKLDAIIYVRFNKV